MTTLLFYQNPIAIDRNTHRDLKIRLQAKGFAYAAAVNSIPLTITEFGIACTEYPIVFVLDDKDSGMPVALTSLRKDENLFVNADGVWDAQYVPAFVRRYPYILQNDDTGTQTRVLVDADAAGFADPLGEPLFNADGSNSSTLTNVLGMLQQFSTATQQTADLVRQLRKLDLLTGREVSATTPKGVALQMNGFFVIDDEKLNKLDDAQLLQLTKSGMLAIIQAHLISMNNIAKLLKRIDA